MPPPPRGPGSGGLARKGRPQPTATFNLLKPSGHLNYYGLTFGGSDLEGAGQNYLYFLVAQNGTFIVRRRVGGEVEDVQPRTAHDAIKRPAADGRSANTLEVRVSGNSIAYVVNGTVVHTSPKAGGLAGAAKLQ